MIPKNLFITFIAFAFVNFGFSQKQLTAKEKIADFEYLYQELKASYPYFGINKRAHKTDWLAKKSEYIEAIKKTNNDTEFFRFFNDMINDLNNGHTDAYPTLIYSYFYEAYQQGANQDDGYKIYVKELEKTNAKRCKYWKDINHKLFFADKTEDVEESNYSEMKTVETPLNIDMNFIDSLSTAVIHVKSFSYDLLEKDVDTLAYFFKKASVSKHIVIDIQGNEGGSTEYWMQHMLPYLVKDTLSTPVVYAFKNSERLQEFKPNYFEDTIPHSAIDLENMPEELTDGSYLFRKEEMNVIPVPEAVQYAGKLYLLVDNAVFSSSEALAFFCKATGFATVVGEKTSGDGVGTDPLLLTLPNSGIVIRFTGEMGLNPDGSANDETKTIPDIYMEASSQEERRTKLLQFIYDGKQ